MQGLEKGIDYKKVLKAFKKDFCCNGTVVEDTELGQARFFVLRDFLLQGRQCCTISGVDCFSCWCR